LGGGASIIARRLISLHQQEAREDAVRGPVVQCRWSPARFEQKDVPIYLDGLGTVQAFNTVTVHTRVDGALVQVNFSEGQDVKTGDLLAVVDPKPYQAALDQAKAQATLDQVTLKRQADLRARNVIAQQDYDTAVANAQKSKAAADAAQVNFDYCYIKSPIDGRTGVRLVDIGNVVITQLVSQLRDAESG
jgi:multidrug efflux system membrane fusion protein